MNRMLGTMLFLLAVAAAPAGAELAQPNGELIGKVVHAELGVDHKESACSYIVTVLWDSTYTDPALGRGSTVTLWTVGGWGAVADVELLDGALSTVSMVVGEKVWLIYRMIDGRMYILDKWTVWKKGANGCASCPDQTAKLLSVDVGLEALLTGATSLKAIEDSLEFYPTKLDLQSNARPIPPDGMSWRNYNLPCRKGGRSLGQLRQRVRRMWGGD